VLIFRDLDARIRELRLPSCAKELQRAFPEATLKGRKIFNNRDVNRVAIDNIADDVNV